MRNLRKLVKWSIRVVKVVLLYRLCLIVFVPVFNRKGKAKVILYIERKLCNYSLRFLFEVDYGKTGN